ncbi:MAG: nucleotidyl transferase AbiEii/AbiGii toxin family protein [Phocaeicola sp.]|uniref:nucleotidyl transferase AbiEii/AbiGii toxin family protein n=1 Tax=Porphyromonas TaxID=836 RepID=UPI00297BBAC2|nr:nucleotidyl transferase AbiEii/AbiGii toxin family protein [Porphyromonas sp.]MDD7437499.1 nucleotidyl transferase AbiEii/AbiGii toxin family protein [Bacteroidales bacterium]MDY3067530.1 nucleotidyl transferase AbiEii/AbiGii toxin family protein [Porphyromonas sp.]MDY5938869.1 nucleotidyl transferase AbiEii/AbiGii toxin family protein [Phocaeicola sp.]
MNSLWINNTLEDRLAMLQQTEDSLPGINQSAIEKDWWVTVVLHALSQCSCAPALVFKGGTSLSKGFNLIERFSEDIDLAIHRSFFGIDKTSKSQREKLRKLSRSFIHDDLSKQLDKQLQNIGVSGYQIENVVSQVNQEGEWTPIDSDKDPTVIFLHYKSIVDDIVDYIPSRVKIEISCLSMDEPTRECSIQSMIGERFPDEDTLISSIRTVLPTRTFLEKIFLLAEEFQKDHPRHMRMSRHLYDLERIMDTEYGKEALVNRQLYDAIVEHRRTFYALKYVDYNKHAPSAISFIPRDEFISDWNKDYDNMQAHFLYGSTLSFNELLERMADLQDRVRNIADTQ